MKIRRQAIHRQLLVGMTILGSATVVMAAPTEWRTEVQVSVGSGTGTQFDFDGGLNDPSSSQIISAGQGSVTAVAAASSDLSADGFTPTLRTMATASPVRAQAVAWGVQGYTNGGASPLSTTLMFDLTADITGSNDLKANMYLFQEQNFEFSDDPGTILSESSSQLWPGFEPFANNFGPTGFDMDFNNFTGAITEQRSFDFTVQPGESFYIWSRLVTTADNPGVADAFGTMITSFSETQGLIPAAVPEPASLCLLVIGSLVGLKRSRHR